MKEAGYILGGLFGLFLFIIFLGVLGLGGRYINLQVEGWFAPREQNVQREVFEETKSYNEAKEQELVKYKFEYDKAKGKEDAATMNAIKSAVRHSFADYKTDRLDPDLRNFVNECKGEE